MFTLQLNKLKASTLLFVTNKKAHVESKTEQTMDNSVMHNIYIILNTVKRV